MWGRLKGGDLDMIAIAPRPKVPNQFGLVQADSRFGQGVVVGVADRTDGGVDAGGEQPVGECDGGVLAAGVVVVHQP
jgi:hypothetical protein